MIKTWSLSLCFMAFRIYCSMEEIEQNGGEDAYILVENNVANHEKLNAVGVPNEAINKYGDEKHSIF
ncbi:hypothetical protein ACQKII_06565 [Lysinibacillus sp. NPDC048646]|uniref:hypothetical protein n=1 Tax=Lysinibacillus sp. NPDC048646 TaxID=3390574 RepID=UPI003D03231B